MSDGDSIFILHGLGALRTSHYEITSRSHAHAFDTLGLQIGCHLGQVLVDHEFVSVLGNSRTDKLLDSLLPSDQHHLVPSIAKFAGKSRGLRGIGHGQYNPLLRHGVIVSQA